LMTIEEGIGGDLKEIKVAWIGDGNNVAHSWIHAATLIGFELVLACPNGHEPLAEVLGHAKNARVTIVTDAKEAARGAHVITTDVWTSMGQGAEAGGWS